MRAVTKAIAVASLTLLCFCGAAWAQSGRKAVWNPTPQYPELARKMRLSGVVKVSVVIGADGQIKQADFQGGHPVLIGAVQDALKQWRYAPAGSETRLDLEFKF